MRTLSFLIALGLVVSGCSIQSADGEESNVDTSSEQALTVSCAASYKGVVVKNDDARFDIQPGDVVVNGVRAPRIPRGGEVTIMTNGVPVLQASDQKVRQSKLPVCGRSLYATFFVATTLR